MEDVIYRYFFPFVLFSFFFFFIRRKKFDSEERFGSGFISFPLLIVWFQAVRSFVKNYSDLIPLLQLSNYNRNERNINFCSKKGRKPNVTSALNGIRKGTLVDLLISDPSISSLVASEQFADLQDT